MASPKMPAARPGALPSTGADAVSGVAAAARAFIRAAFHELDDLHVLPRSRYEPWIRIGRNLSGWIVFKTQEFRELDASFRKAFPDRFADQPINPAQYFAFALLQGSIARATEQGGPYDVDAGAVSQSIEELLTILGSPNDVVCSVRLVSHVDTAVSLESVTSLRVVPISKSTAAKNEISEKLDELLPGSRPLVEEAKPFLFTASKALLVSRGEYRDFFTGVPAITEQFDAFVSALRLATGATAQNVFQINGQPFFVHPYGPYLETYPYRGSLLVERAVRLDPSIDRGVSVLSELLTKLVAQGEGVNSTVALALRRFNRSFETETWQDRLVDLTIGFEAALMGAKLGEEVTLRLRTRAAQLLACDSDSGIQIYEDVGQIYGLRSDVVHGNPITSQGLKERFKRIAACRESSSQPIQIELCIDRLRDLLRRAILARLFLAEGLTNGWPISGRADVEVQLLSDQTKQEWRDHWQGRLLGLGLEQAAKPAAAPSIR